jgi:hypothetical protein
MKIRNCVRTCPPNFGLLTLKLKPEKKNYPNNFHCLSSQEDDRSHELFLECVMNFIYGILMKRTLKCNMEGCKIRNDKSNGGISLSLSLLHVPFHC